MRRRLSSSFALVVLCIATTTTTAHGFERQWHAGADATWAAVTWHDSTYGGYGAGAHLAYGLRDDFNALLEVGATSHPVWVDRPSLLVASGSVGVAYTLDVLEWVPYFGLLVGGYHVSGAELGQGELKLGFQGTAGMDYRFSRDFAVGAQLRYHTFAGDPFTAHYMTVSARFEYLWGW